MLDSYRGVLRVGDQLCGSSRSSAEILENLEVKRSWVNDTGVGPLDELVDEKKDLVQG